MTSHEVHITVCSGSEVALKSPINTQAWSAIREVKNTADGGGLEESFDTPFLVVLGHTVHASFGTSSMSFQPQAWFFGIEGACI